MAGPLGPAQKRRKRAAAFSTKNRRGRAHNDGGGRKGAKEREVTAARDVGERGGVGAGGSVGPRVNEDAR